MERCDPSPDCPLFPDCFEDDHHTFYPEQTVRRIAGTAFFLCHVERAVCRSWHNQQHVDTPTNLPSREQIQVWHKDPNDLSEMGGQ